MPSLATIVAAPVVVAAAAAVESTIVASSAAGLLAAVVVTALAGYLIGSVPVANLVAGRRAGIDLRTTGDRNPGYWNARQSLDRRAATSVFVGDVAKGATAAAVGLALGATLGDHAAGPGSPTQPGAWTWPWGDSGSWSTVATTVWTTPWWWLAYVGAGAAMVGHAFPVFAGFRGGRSVLAFVGGALVAAPVPAAIAVAVLLLVLAARRDFAVAARVGIVAFPVAQLATEGPYRTAATGALMTFIGIRFATASRPGAGSRSDDPARSGDA